VFNKIDRNGESPRIDRDDMGRPVRVWLSAARGDGVELLRQCLQEMFGARPERFRVGLRAGDGRLRAALYAARVVQAERVTPDGGLELEVEMPREQLRAACAGAALEFDDAVSPCLPEGGFVEFPRAATALS
jgi:GTPase